MNHLHYLVPLMSSQHPGLPTPLRVAIIVGLAIGLLAGLMAAAMVAVAVLIFGSRYLGGTTR